MEKNQAKSSIVELIDKEKSFFISLSNISSCESDLCCIDGKIIGTGQSDYTQSSAEYNLDVNGNNFLLIDIPGIEGDEGKYKEIIEKSLMKSHVIFYINGAGKKNGSGTIEKIKNYMHDGTSVYAIFNVHCKPKKERIEGIDKSYQEELAEAYKKYKEEIVLQTEAELKSFLGDNFKGSVCVNGLLSFCSVAVDCYGNSTIVEDEDKNLRSTQAKFLKEYSNDLNEMRKDCSVLEIQRIITDKIAHFDEYILEENLKKLKTRLSDMISDITSMRDIEKARIKNFFRDYDGFAKKCEMARDDFIRAIDSIGRNEATKAFSSVQEKIFKEIEQRKGKIKQEDVEQIFKTEKDKIAANISNAVTQKINSAMKEYDESIQDAQSRLLEDLQRNQMQFEINVKMGNYNFSSLKNRITFKGIAGGAFTVLEYAYSGFAIGSIFPGVGNIVGTVVGALVGLCMMLWQVFVRKSKRIDNAKAKIKTALDEQIEFVVEYIKKEIERLEIKSKISQNYDDIYKRILSQKKALQNVEEILNVVVMELNSRYRKI